MSDKIEFEGDSRASYTSTNPNSNYQAGLNPELSDQPRMARWLMKHGIVKSPNSAQVILLIVIVVNLAIIFFVMKSYL